MECFIYKGHRKHDTYLYITKDGDFSKVPQSLLDLLGQLEFVLSISLDKHRKLANADAQAVLSCLKDQGYYLQLPPCEDSICLS